MYNLCSQGVHKQTNHYNNCKHAYLVRNVQVLQLMASVNFLQDLQDLELNLTSRTLKMNKSCTNLARKTV